MPSCDHLYVHYLPGVAEDAEKPPPANSSARPVGASAASRAAKAMHAAAAAAGVDLRLLYTGGFKSHLPLYPEEKLLASTVGKKKRKAVLVGPTCRGEGFVRAYEVRDFSCCR